MPGGPRRSLEGLQGAQQPARSVWLVIEPLLSPSSGGDGHLGDSSGLLSAHDVGLSYGQREVLDLDLTFCRGVTAVIGPNGAGKSSLMNLLSTAIRPQRGNVVWQGRDIDTKGKDQDEYRRHLGWVPQDVGHPPRMRVESFLAYAAWLKEVPRKSVDDHVTKAVDFGDLKTLRRRRIGELSGGQRRRLMLATAVVGDVEVLLLDEPTVGLDPMQREALLELVRIVGEWAVVVVATHLLEDVVGVAERVVVLDNGRAPFEGSLSDFTRLGNSSEATVDACRQALRVVTARGEGLQ